eukprot:TRINITY_DN48565_c0_g1_i1.p1 TRINITY_DN48565_c0_g1~~TRINITY_DN48565_c0_g1_i1.p1  ORF type:complete len:369 (+),score=40.17 TRINITY_DN48565_c0_g1_i1:38-1144(+)
MMFRVLLFILPLFIAGQNCWEGGASPELCCPGPGGNPDCWEPPVYTYETCCAGWGLPPKASDSVAELKIDAGAVPALPLLDGGKMPMSGIGLCCRPTAQGDAVRQAVLDYLTMGGRHLDDAMLYNNHVEVGKGVRQAVELGIPREEIYFVTKIWSSDFGFEATTAWVERALEQLGLDYIDMVLLHVAKVNPGELPCDTPKACRQETWLALQRAQKKGLIKHLGVSNFGPRQMQELIDLGGSPIVANQLEYHPWVPRPHRETVAWCHQHGIAVTAYGSMGSSGMAQQMVGIGDLQAIGGQYGKSAGQVLLRWAVQNNVSVIPGTSNPKHMAENLRIFDFKLSASEMDVLNNIPESQHMHHFGHTPDSHP